MLTSGTYSGIKSVQRFPITIPANTTSASQAITAVNPAKSELRYLGCNYGDTNTTGGMAYVTLTNSTTVTASRCINSSTFALVVQFEVTEWY